MANVYLGLNPVALNPLPPFRWTGGGNPAFPHDMSKQLEKARMLDGSQHFNMKSKSPRSWGMAWEMLTVAEFAAFKLLRSYNQALYFRNEWEDVIWREVMITNFQPEPNLKLGPTACRWNLNMTLEEVGG